MCGLALVLTWGVCVLQLCLFKANTQPRRTQEWVFGPGLPCLHPLSAQGSVPGPGCTQSRLPWKRKGSWTRPIRSCCDSLGDLLSACQWPREVSRGIILTRAARAHLEPGAFKPFQSCHDASHSPSTFPRRGDPHLQAGAHVAHSSNHPAYIFGFV